MTRVAHIHREPSVMPGLSALVTEGLSCYPVHKLSVVTIFMIRCSALNEQKYPVKVTTRLSNILGSSHG